jgi:transcriptional antiterminator RfaH
VEQDAQAWFLAQIRPNSAQIALRNLARQGFATFFPQEEGTRRSRGRFEPVLKPLFPSYLFVRFDPALGHWRAINSTHGLTRLVSFAATPAPVPEDLVTRLQQRCDATGKLLPPRAFEPGDSVRLTSGPFADFVATVDSLSPDRRVWVLLDLMGRQTRVAVQPEQLRET